MTSVCPFWAALNRGVYPLVCMESTSAPWDKITFMKHTKECAMAISIYQIGQWLQRWTSCVKSAATIFLHIPLQPLCPHVMPHSTNPTGRTKSECTVSLHREANENTAAEGTNIVHGIPCIFGHLSQTRQQLDSSLRRLIEIIFCPQSVIPTSGWFSFKIDSDHKGKETGVVVVLGCWCTLPALFLLLHQLGETPKQTSVHQGHPQQHRNTSLSMARQFYSPDGLQINRNVPFVEHRSLQDPQKSFLNDISAPNQDSSGLYEVSDSPYRLAEGLLWSFKNFIIMILSVYSLALLIDTIQLIPHGIGYPNQSMRKLYRQIWSNRLVIWT